MKSEEDLARHRRVQTPSGLIYHEQRRSPKECSRQSSLSPVASAQMLDPLKEMLFHVKQLGQVEYLFHHFLIGEAFELSFETQVVEESEGFFQIVLV